MKRIGLLGGMSWESSAEYYRLINEATLLTKCLQAGIFHRVSLVVLRPAT